MAVKDESLHHATEKLILPTPRKFYRADIHTSHWQLRSLVSSPKPNIIVYPSGTTIVRLDTKTRERQIITTLSYTPRSLVAEGGWICCGGDYGDYTAILLGEGKPNHDFDPDARLPLDLDPARRTRELQSTSRRSGIRPDILNVSKIGDDLVNCITIWSPVPNLSKRAYKIPVAVVANNDRTASILNLRSSTILEKLKYPDYVNRAVISPNGELLVAICDDPFLYIHRRQRRAPSKKELALGKKAEEYEWKLWGRRQLEGQKNSDKENMRGSFAAAFSKNGRYLAVATQYGVISVFETEYLTQDVYDPVLVVFTSSRPNTLSGAVRSMEFSPEPFDLLAWTENSGRVGVADVRDLFSSRQRLIIDSRGDGVERVIVTERNDLLDPRLRSSRAESPSMSSTPDYLGLDFERRQLSSLTRDMLDRHQAPLTAEELEVLQAHRVARRQRDAARDANVQRDGNEWGQLGTPRSDFESRWDIYLNPNRSTLSARSQGGSGTDRRISTTGIPSALREFVNADRTSASLREFITERNQDRERRANQEPRRQSSMILAATADAEGGNNDTSSSLERLTLTPLPPLSIGNETSTSPWAEIEALYRTRFPTDRPDRSTRQRVEVEDEDRRDFAHRLRQPWRPLDELSQTGLGSREENSTLRAVLRSGGGCVDTMGCCWSQDGRIFQELSIILVSTPATINNRFIFTSIIGMTTEQDMNDSHLNESDLSESELTEDESQYSEAGYDESSSEASESREISEERMLAREARLRERTEARNAARQSKEASFLKTMTYQSTSPLLNLPREIRDKIWDELMLGNVIHISRKPDSWDFLYQSCLSPKGLNSLAGPPGGVDHVNCATSSTSDFSNVHLVCKQMYLELLDWDDKLLSHNALHFGDLRVAEDFLFGLTELKRASITHLRLAVPYSLTRLESYHHLQGPWKAINNYFSNPWDRASLFMGPEEEGNPEYLKEPCYFYYSDCYFAHNKERHYRDWQVGFGNTSWNMHIAELRYKGEPKLDIAMTFPTEADLRVENRRRHDQKAFRTDFEGNPAEWLQPLLQFHGYKGLTFQFYDKDGKRSTPELDTFIDLLQEYVRGPEIGPWKSVFFAGHPYGNGNMYIR
ncbi:hypothetical protein B7494_g412 [Chlorociboria aeruginascens]|nr:hypothetical protein B7494_g412 [Chlorociboria aeruginascens]